MGAGAALAVGTRALGAAAVVEVVGPAEAPAAGPTTGYADCADAAKADLAGGTAAAGLAALAAAPAPNAAAPNAAMALAPVGDPLGLLLRSLAGDA